MVMPMIGTLSDERAQQMIETALRGVHTHGARIVILDVTGLRLVDGGVAGTLLRMAGALRLLGAEGVVTGVRADLAQALVELDMDLGDAVTRGTLKDGIAYALRRAG